MPIFPFSIFCIVLIRSKQGDLQYAYGSMCFIVVAIMQCNAHCSPLTFFGKNNLYGGLFGGYFARLVEVTVNMKAWFNAVFDGLKKVENRIFPNLNGLAENRCQSLFGNKLLHCKEGPSELILQYTSVPGFPARKYRYLVMIPVPGIPGESRVSMEMLHKTCRSRSLLLLF